ncbi:MAG: dihydrofolate reductase family protein [Acidimicrobiales bacterium]|jgi:dihydrofolate reductase
MTKVITGLSTSLDGFIAGAEDSPTQPLGLGGDRLFKWFSDGETPSRFYEWMKMSPESAAFFDEHAGRVGAVVTGRRTYDVTNGWSGTGPLPGVPLFVLTHRVPEVVPSGHPPYTFITDGIEHAISQARKTAGDKDVSVMGATVVQQCLRAGLLDELTIDLVPVVLGRGARLLDGLEREDIELELLRVIDAPGVTHLTYRVAR